MQKSGYSRFWTGLALAPVLALAGCASGKSENKIEHYKGRFGCYGEMTETFTTGDEKFVACGKDGILDRILNTRSGATTYIIENPVKKEISIGPGDSVVLRNSPDEMLLQQKFNKVKSDYKLQKTKKN